MEQAVRCLVTGLKIMPRLELLEIIYVNCVKNIPKFKSYCHEVVLEPFAELVGLRNVSIEGDLSDEYAAYLRSSMMRSKTPPVKKTEKTA